MSDDKVIEFPGITSVRVPPHKVIENAPKWVSNADDDDVVVIGYDEHGNIGFSSSTSGIPDILFLLEHCKKQLMEWGDD